MKNIHNLIPDIYSLVSGEKGWFTNDIARELSNNLSQRLQSHFGEERGVPTLRLSKMGPECPCALWHSIHRADLAEPLPPWATIKYSYGHILEALVIALAKAAGHTVTGEQDELVVDGIRGHRDCVIDGCVCDVKSSSTRGFVKFKDKSIQTTDTFGYLDQLDGYLVGSAEDSLVSVKDKGYLIAVDKQLGHMVLYEHKVRMDSIRKRIVEAKATVALPSAPKCECGTVADGKSGNYRLDVKGSYSAYKHCCFPNLRTFLYSDGPRYLVKVVRRPDVIEVDKTGKIVYNYG